MKIALVTGSGGLIGSETCKRLHAEGYAIVGVDNDMRAYFFGEEASTLGTRQLLRKQLQVYHDEPADIRDWDAVEFLFKKFGFAIAAVVHTAAQPSHDWAAKEPLTDFAVNAQGTMYLLEATRKYCPEAVFIFTSTNKVYGDTPNRLPLVEKETRWEIDESHPYFAKGIDESMSIDNSKHSIFGANKVAADIMVQEYGKYFGMKTGVFRGGCLTGPAHAGAELHGFLAYLMKCTVTGRPYNIYGYKGKQVRDNIHSHDLVDAFVKFIKNPRPGEVYNMGGSRHSNCSMLEAIKMCEDISGNKLDWNLLDDNRIGDHIWYVSDVSKFQSHYPDWEYKYDLQTTLEEIYKACALTK
jgi:CDP-paratose 2-epimerase